MGTVARVWLHLLGKGHLSENGCIDQNIKQLWCASGVPRLKGVHRLPCSLNRNLRSTLEMKHKCHEVIETKGRD